jgi:Sec-independent protein translocase protein TatA
LHRTGKKPSVLSIPDMAILGAAALLLFGPDQLPRVARKAGSVMRDIQNTSQSFIREMERAADIQDAAAAKPEPPPFESAAYDPVPYHAGDEVVDDHVLDEPAEPEPQPAPIADHNVRAYEPPAPDPEAPPRALSSVAEKLAEPRPALDRIEPSVAAEAAPQPEHSAHL